MLNVNTSSPKPLLSPTYVAFMTPAALRTSTLTHTTLPSSSSSSFSSSLTRPCSFPSPSHTPTTTIRHSRSRCRRARTRHLPVQSTLSPKDCSWRSERDLRAIESEFYVTMHSPGVVDNDMHRLRRRMIVLGRKEKQWSDFCQQFASLSVMTGIPMVNSENGEPTATAWIFLSLSAAFPLYILSSVAQWLHNSPLAFHQVDVMF